MEQDERLLDRRKKMRFPIHHELRYTLLDRKFVVAQGTGVTLDISSKSVSFRFAEPIERLKSGAFIELSMSWSASLGGETPLRLVTFGRVIRMMGASAACTIDRHEFRTQAKVPEITAVLEVASGLAQTAGNARGHALPAAQGTDRKAACAAG